MSVRSKDNIFSKILWFDKRDRFDIDYFDLLLPCREVTQTKKYCSSLIHSAKSSRKIQYESALELSFIKRLETSKHVVFYWDQPVKIPYWRGRRKVTYTPDFGIYLASGHFVLSEVKELSGMLDYRVQMKTVALMEFCAKRGFGLLLTDGRHTPKDLLNGRVNRKLERELLAALAQNVLRQPQCREIMEKCNATQHELFKAVIRLGLHFQPFPMKLKLGKENRIFKQVFFEGKKYNDLMNDRFPSIFGSILSL